MTEGEMNVESTPQDTGSPEMAYVDGHFIRKDEEAAVEGEAAEVEAPKEDIEEVAETTPEEPVVPTEPDVMPETVEEAPTVEEETDPEALYSEIDKDFEALINKIDVFIGSVEEKKADSKKKIVEYREELDTTTREIQEKIKSEEAAINDLDKKTEMAEAMKKRIAGGKEPEAI